MGEMTLKQVGDLVSVNRADLELLLECNRAASQETTMSHSGIDFIEERGGAESDDLLDRVSYHLYYSLFPAMRIRAALAHPRPAVPEVAISDGDMFWTDDCEEYSLPSIDELVEGWVDGGTEDGTVVKVERAKRLPAVLVKVNVSDDSYGYKLLSAAPESGGG